MAEVLRSEVFEELMLVSNLTYWYKKRSHFLVKCLHGIKMKDVLQNMFLVTSMTRADHNEKQREKRKLITTICKSKVAEIQKQSSQECT